MSENKKRAPTPVSADVGAGPVKAYDDNSSIAQPGEECKPELGYFADVNRKPGYYAIVPASVRYDTRLPPNAKLLYGELTALAQMEGYCWASNDYLAKLYGLSRDNVGRLIAQLERCGYITREIVRDEKTNAVTGRKIWICWSADPSLQNCTPPPCKNADPSLQNCGDPPCKIAGENNTSINNIPPIVPQEKKTKKGKETAAEVRRQLSAWAEDKPADVGTTLEEFVTVCRDNNVKNGCNPLSARGARILTNKLETFSQGNPQIMVSLLKNAIEHNWLTVYKPKTEIPRNAGSNQEQAPSGWGDNVVSL